MEPQIIKKTSDYSEIRISLSDKQPLPTLAMNPLLDVQQISKLT